MNVCYMFHMCLYSIKFTFIKEGLRLGLGLEGKGVCGWRLVVIVLGGVDLLLYN